MSADLFAGFSREKILSENLLNTKENRDWEGNRYISFVATLPGKISYVITKLSCFH